MNKDYTVTQLVFIPVTFLDIYLHIKKSYNN